MENSSLPAYPTRPADPSQNNSGPIPLDILKHHISKYNTNKNARRVCRAWYHALETPWNCWLSMATPSPFEYRDRLVFATTCQKVDFRTDFSMSERIFHSDVAQPAFDSLQLAGPLVLSECIHASISTEFFHRFDIKAPKLRLLILNEAWISDPKRHNPTRLFNRILESFPLLESLVMRSIAVNVIDDYLDGLLDRLPKLRYLEVQGPHKSILLNQTLSLQSIKTSWPYNFGATVINIPNVQLGLHHGRAEAPDILPSESVTSFTLTGSNRSHMERLLDPSVFPCLERLCVQPCGQETFPSILRRPEIVSLHLGFKSYDDAVALVNQLAAQAESSSFSLRRLVIDVGESEKYVGRIKWSGMMQRRAAKMIEPALLRLVESDRLPHLKVIHLAPHYVKTPDMTIHQQLLEKGISLLYYTPDR